MNFSIIDDLESRGEHNGPVLISSDNGLTGLSIFNSANQDNHSLPAFGTDGLSFIKLSKKFSQPRIYDHYRFLSFYIRDGDGNKLEICCMDYEVIKKTIANEGITVFLMSPESYIP